MMKNFKFVICCFVLLFSTPAMAGNPLAEFLNNLFPAAGDEMTAPAPVILPTVSLVDANVYASLTPQNLMKLYAHLGVLDVAEPKHLDQYLAVNECKLYTEFRANEFEWSKIRIATQDSIRKSKDNFSRQFQFAQPLMLNEFDFAKGGFPILDNFVIPPVTQIQMTDNNLPMNECAGRENSLPLQSVLSLARPFSLSLVLADQAAAEFYVAYLKKNNIDTRDGRPAYIQFKVSEDGLAKPIDANKENYAVLKGKIDRIVIYGDKDLTIKLYEQVF